MQFLSRRLHDFMLKLVGRHPTDYAQELQDAIEALWNQATGGIPGGFNANAPVVVLIGGTADPGHETAGWMAADAQLVAVRGTPVAIAFANSPGTSTDAAAADHVHDGTALIAAAESEARRFAFFHANIGSRA